MLVIRNAENDDLKAITEIYNEAIINTVATFDTQPKNIEEQKPWFEAHGPSCPIIVLEDKGMVCGWASLSRWSDRCAYSDTAELSVYVKAEFRGRGIGKQLLEAIVEKGREAGLHTLLARIAEGNEASLSMHEAVGFEHIGVMREVGRKFGKLLDVHLMQLIY